MASYLPIKRLKFVVVTVSVHMVMMHKQNMQIEKGEQKME